MHPGQVPVAPEVARRLVDGQFPQWAHLPLTPVAEAGTDHVLLRLGHELVVRLPIIGWAVGQAALEARWLPVLAPHLPLPVPVPVALGQPAHGYPHPWSVGPWLPGEAATTAAFDAGQAAVDLAAFVRALHAAPADGGPLQSGTARGTPLAGLDTGVRRLIDELQDEIDAPALRVVWDAAVRAPVWDAPPVWLHGDLQPGNLIVRDQRLSAVIDFRPGLGDPAPDVAAAWWLFAPADRSTYLDAVGYDEHVQTRARGWVLAPALAGLGYYRDTRPDLSLRSRAHLAALLA